MSKHNSTSEVDWYRKNDDWTARLGIITMSITLKHQATDDHYMPESQYYWSVDIDDDNVAWDCADSLRTAMNAVESTARIADNTIAIIKKRDHSNEAI